MTINTAFYRRQSILDQHNRDELERKKQLQEISETDFRCYLQVTNTETMLLRNSKKRHTSNILRKEGKLKKQKLDKIVSDKKTKANIEVWGIEATVKALEFTENILYHQRLRMSDVKFGENKKMKNAI